LDRKINLFSSNRRKELIQKISSDYFDVVVIGGGITGAGICLDAISRGLNVCLVEMNDFASGTSSKSTKLIHGGLRYLEQFKFKLVHESGTERAILHNIAPHIVKPQRMLLPISRDGKLNRLTTSLALTIYDYLAGVKGSEKKKMLSKKDTIEREPLLIDKKIIGGALYSEYRTDDSRLTIEILKKASALGAFPVNYLKAEKFIYENEIIVGINCRDKLSEKNVLVKSKILVNASGAWTDDVLKEKNKKLILSKGIHIVVPLGKFPIKQSVYFDAIDSRMLFAIPRDKMVYIGTTDTFFDRKKEKLLIKKKEVDYLIKSLNNFFLVNIKEKDITSSWVGLRPLIKENKKNVSEISRKDEIFDSKNGLITIAGGKLTGYRKMAERVVNVLLKKLDFSSKKSQTKDLKLFEFHYDNFINQTKDLKISSHDLSKIYNVYGDNAIEIFRIHKRIDSNYKDYSLLISEIIYCFKNEMCHNLLDFFSQRNSMVYFEIDKIMKSLNFIKKPYKELKNINEDQWRKESEELKKYIFEITNFI